MKTKNHALTSFKGFIVGSTMVIPGVSGGTMAIILGIYKDLIHAITSLRKEFKKSVILLFEFVVGAVIGFLLLADLIEMLLKKFEQPTMFFFIGAILGGIPLLVRESKIDVKKPNDILTGVISLAVGIALVICIGKIPPNVLSFEGSMGLSSVPLVVLTGIIIAIALVLPGISTSHMLLILGMYDYIITIKSHIFDSLGFIIALGISVVIGIFLITKPIEILMDKFPKATYIAIIGFVIGSVIDVFPAMPTGVGIVWCAVTIVCGYFAMRKISDLSIKN